MLTNKITYIVLVLLTQLCFVSCSEENARHSRNKISTKAAMESLSKKPSAAEFQKVIKKYSARNVLSGVYSDNERFNYILGKISTGDKQWYLVAKKLRKVSDAGASEQLGEAMAKAFAKDPTLEPNSPEIVFKGQETDSFSGAEEAKKLKTALKKAGIPFTVQLRPSVEIVSWPRKYTPKVRAINSDYVCSPKLPEDRTFDLGADFKKCLEKKRIPYSTPICYGQEFVLVSKEVAKRVYGPEELCLK